MINSATLKLKQNGALTGNPLGTLGNMQVDLRKPNFGLSPNLELADFNFAATSANVCTIGKVPSLGWYSGVLNAAGKSNLNKAGLTQFRVFFTLDDNNNLVADTIKFFSGNSISANWPQLIVNYTLP